MEDHTTGFAIALAWPATFCKQPGAWYDRFTHFIGISKHGYYKVGHAAVVLVDQSANGNCHYFDFGRYHSPFGTGRVRSERTDHELKIELKAVVDSLGQFTNYAELVELLANKEACHGTGKVHASRIAIDFKLAYSKAIEMQSNSPIPYGPFIRTGTNCSRFVRNVIRAGVVTKKDRIRLLPSVFITPTPISNVRKLNHPLTIQPTSEQQVFNPTKQDDSFLKNTLPIPILYPNLSEHAKWFAGEGAGSWFILENESTRLRIKRYNAFGELECDSYCVNAKKFHPQLSFEIAHPSNCSQLTIKQRNTLFQFSLHPIQNENEKQNEKLAVIHV